MPCGADTMQIDINSQTAQWRQDLIKDIRYHDSRDDLDWNNGEFPEVPYHHIEVRHPTNGYIITMSPCNLHQLKEYFALVKNSCRAILEIGVNHNSTPTEMTSTSMFIAHKKKETIYLGVDINDKSSLNDACDNVFTLQIDSTNIFDVMQHASLLKIPQFDFIFIDGWHSINQVMREWEYTKYLSNNGIIAFHDTAVHPGPNLFLKNLDRQKWNVIENCCGFDHNDFGIGIAWRKK
jgi:hypothetical protein